MAHEFETGFFVGVPAWHGLGTVLDNPPSLTEAIKIAGLDWPVSLVDLQTVDGQPVTHRAVMRDTDGTILGVVGPDYTPLQNSEAFAWFSPFVESGACKLEAAGSLREGKRVWVLAKIADCETEILPGDEIARYLLLAHGHDGTLAVRCGFTDVRVVCQNTLTMAIGGGSLLKIKHTKNLHQALELVQSVIDVQRREFAATAEQMRELARFGCDDETMRQYIREVFAPGKTEPDAAKTLVKKIEPLFTAGQGCDLPGVRGTMWAAYNAVTEFVTHHRGRSADNRLDSQWFGSGAGDLGRALAVALEMVRGKKLLK